MALIDEIGPGPVALDSVVLIYYIENHPRFADSLDDLFRRIDSGEVQALTSALTLMETLVVPYRSGNRELAASYERILTSARGVKLVPIDLDVLRLAAEIRAATQFKAGDAIQLSAALRAGCMTFLTNDRRLPVVGDLRILQLNAFA